MKYTYILESKDEVVLTGSCETEQEFFQSIHQHKEQKKISEPYCRFWNETRDGQVYTCVDFGSYTDFFYIHPPLNP